MLLPLLIIPRVDGVPIPNGYFTVSSKGRTELHSVSVEGKAQFVICVARENIPWESLATETNPKQYIYPIGVLCSITDGAPSIRVETLERVRIYSVQTESATKFSAEITHIQEDFVAGEEEAIPQIKGLVTTICSQPEVFGHQLVDCLDVSNPLIESLNVIANDMISIHNERLKYLLSPSQNERLGIVIGAINKNLVSPRPKKAKRRSLSRKPKPEPKLPSLEEKFNTTPFPANIKNLLEYELGRLQTLPRESSERASITNYLNWAMDIPWGKTSEKQLDLGTFKSELNKTHYGLEDTKEHLLEHVAIERITEKSSGSVLCFVGPPGVGKTSISKSIARANNRKLYSIALGALSDEAELRGTRRTYLASRPGRFIVGLKATNTFNPLIVLDEIDKMSHFRGDPTSALLEILDPEQNSKFVDHYLEFPVDLSKVMFICTANYEEQIPGPLKDRMEMIPFRNYSLEERRHILEKFILPKALSEYKIDEYPIDIKEEVLASLAETTGLREIERKIKKLLRMAATQIYVYKKDSVTVDRTFAKKVTNSKAKQKLGF